MADNELSFEELERRIRAMPDGPSAVLNTPRWALHFAVLGTAGIVIGLLPSLLIQFMEPRMWMAYMVQAGVWIAIVGYAPEFFRAVWVIVNGFVRWKRDLVRQLDHDLAQARELNRWLVSLPKETLEDHARFAKHVEIRLHSKLGLLMGSMDKLGIIPILAALGILLLEYRDPGKLTPWVIYLGLFLAITYLIAWLAAHMRLRVQLYEALLTSALDKKG
ncbi:MAG TPA: hypothetical protein VJ806_16580 [Luteimonas sp.]|nr:hypothetical protein [Luteimonas sp.]